MSQNYFYQFISKEAYSSTVQLCNVKVLPLLRTGNCSWNVQELRDALSNPDSLTLEELRGVALAVCGTEFETKNFARYLLKRVHNDFDSWLVSACVESNYLDVCLMEAYLATGVTDFAECIFALQFLPEGNDRQTVLRKIDYNLDIEFMTEQPAISLWLLKNYSADERCQVELLELLFKCYKSVPKLNASLYRKLQDYNIGRCSALRCAFALHNFQSNYSSRGKVMTRLAEALAVSAVPWSDESFEWIRKHDGKLGQKIIKRCNYQKYYEEFGFHFPELDFNENDFVELNSVRQILSDTDKCRLACEKQLGIESVDALGIEFSEWDEQLLEYHNSLGSKRGTWQYFIKERTFDELETDEEKLVWALIVDDISDEEILTLLPVCKEQSLYTFVKLVAKMDDTDVLTEEDAKLYNELRWKWIKKDFDYTLDDYETGKYKFREYPCMWKYRDYDFSAIDYDFSTIEKILEMHDSTETLDAMRDLDFSDRDLLEVSKGFNVVDVIKQYRESELTANEFLESVGIKQMVVKKVLDEETQSILEYSDSFTLSFREWTGLEFQQCLQSESFRELFKKKYLIQSYRNNARFDSCMGPVFRSWVLDGSPMRALWDKYASWYCYDSNVIDWWCEHVSKDLRRTESCNDFAPFYGFLHGHKVFLSDVGMIVDEDFEEGSEVPFPVWKCSDAGEEIVFEFGGCMLDDGMQVPWQDEFVFDRGQYQVKMLMCN